MSAGLERILCFSSAVQDAISITTLSILVGSSETRNKTSNITGVLMTDRTSFVHVLEGESHKLDSLIEKLSNDGRHRDFRILARREVSVRRYEEWTLIMDEKQKIQDPWITSVINFITDDKNVL